MPRVSEAGKVEIEKMLLKHRGGELNIEALVLETVIFEDIFANTMSGYITIRDAASFATQLPLTGIEVLEVKFRTPSYAEQVIEKKFHITAVDERSVGNSQQGYVLTLIAIEAYRDNVTRLTKKYSGKTSDIIKSIYESELNEGKKLVSMEEHVSNAALVAPHWSPLKVINWLCTRSYVKAPNVLFFEGNKNFYLSSIENLSKMGTANVYDTFVYTSASSTEQGLNVQNQYKQIASITAMNFLDVFRGQDYGYYASKLITHDIVTKEYYETVHDQFTYHETYNTLHNGNTQMFPKTLIRNPDMYRKVKTKHFSMFNENKETKPETWAPQRNSLMYEADNLKLVVEVPGRTDMEVGKVVKLEIPKSIAKDTKVNTPTDMLDPFLSGLYLITSIRHHFLGNKHTVHLECMKDSYSKSIN